MDLKHLKNYSRLRNHISEESEMTLEEISEEFTKMAKKSSIHGRYKICSGCAEPMFTIEAFLFLKSIEDKGLKMFKRQYWIRLWRKIEIGELLNDEHNLYQSLATMNE